MARIKSGRTAPVTLSCKFGGIGKHTPLSPVGAEDTCNFRVLPNGVLRVRSGYARKKHFSSGKKVRGVWEGTLGGSSLFFSVVGSTVYRLSGETMNETIVGTVNDDTENVHFCAFEDVLYLLDGRDIWVYSTSSDKFEALEPYVPLYGYSWSPTTYGDVKEEINLLTPRLRVHYYNSSAETTFTLPYYASSVEVVYADGKRTTDYSFSAGSNKITFSTPPTIVEVGFTVSLNEEARTAILASQMSYVYTREGKNQLFVWGKDARLFPSRGVTSPMLSSCRVLYPKASPLYFCAEDILFLGDGAHPVTAVCPLYETMLAFTSDRIWNLSYVKDELQATLAMSGIGCASQQGAIHFGDGALVAMDGGVYHVTASPARPEEPFLERLSVGVDEKFPVGFCQRVQLVHNFAEGEIWMRDPEDTTGTVWVWSFEAKEWYRFEGIAASMFFKTADGIGFASGSDLFLFGRDCTTDDGAPIDAYYKSAYLDLGTPDRPRRSLRAFLYASPAQEDFEVVLKTEQREQTHPLFAPSYTGAPRLHDMRVGTHRYQFLRFVLSVSAEHPVEFYRLDVYSGL